MLNVQADLRRRLADALSPIAVRVRIPEDRPQNFVLVFREGGGENNALIDCPGIGIYCYGESEAKACDLAETVADFMRALAFSDGYCTIECESKRSDFDIDANTPRWYLSYSITTYEPSI